VWGAERKKCHLGVDLRIMDSNHSAFQKPVTAKEYKNNQKK